MATPEMTAELEKDMDEIAAGEITKDDVLRISREMLHGTTTELRSKREDLAKEIWAGMDEDKFLGPCPVCEEAGRTHEDGSPEPPADHRPARRQALLGCEGYNRDNPEDPDSCRSTPARCPAAATSSGGSRSAARSAARRPRLTVKGFRGRPWKLCLNDDCPTMVEMREKRAERQAAKAAREAAKAEAEAARPRRPPRQARRRPTTAPAKRRNGAAEEAARQQTTRPQARPRQHAK